MYRALNIVTKLKIKLFFSSSQFGWLKSLFLFLHEISLALPHQQKYNVEIKTTETENDKVKKIKWKKNMREKRNNHKERKSFFVICFWHRFYDENRPIAWWMVRLFLWFDSLISVIRLKMKNMKKDKILIRKSLSSKKKSDEREIEKKNVGFMTTILCLFNIVTFDI